MSDVVLQLVFAYLQDHPELHSVFVRSYTQLRYDAHARRTVATRVQGHWRQRASWKGVMRNLSLTCKFPHLPITRALSPPPTPVRTRRDEDGALIPRPFRVLIWI